MNIMRAAKLELDQEVDARVEDGVLIVKPARDRKAELKSLLSQITPENCHEAVETGAPVGNEIW